MQAQLHRDPIYKEARYAYYQAVEKKEFLPRAEYLWKKLEDSYGPLPTIQAYKFCLDALKARYSWLPWEKAKYFRSATEGLDWLVDRNPQEPEIRFLRGSFYYYVGVIFPSFREKACQDMRVITQHLLNSFEALKEKYGQQAVYAMRDFILQSGCVSSQELTRLRKLN
ncbi:MAG: hypothetical protein ACUVRD_05355 [Bacteroidia bacterium]